MKESAISHHEGGRGRGCVPLTMYCLFGKWIAFLCARSVVWVRSCCRWQLHPSSA